MRGTGVGPSARFTTRRWRYGAFDAGASRKEGEQYHTTERMIEIDMMMAKDSILVQICSDDGVHVIYIATLVILLIFVSNYHIVVLKLFHDTN